jgi:2-hydroxyacyl-CoA lyase 1
MQFGYTVVAESLASQGVTLAYGVVGVPVIELGMAMQASGLKYLGFRNEQQASYAAGIAGYLSRSPAVCLCVSGPGHTNALSGLANAMVNAWPMLLVSGSSDLSQDGLGSFQEADQLACARPFVKMAQRVTSIELVPFFVKEAVRISLSGRPGPVYL